MIAWTDIAVCILARCARRGKHGLLAKGVPPVRTGRAHRDLVVPVSSDVPPQGTTIRPLLQGVPS